MYYVLILNLAFTLQVFGLTFEDLYYVVDLRYL